MIQTRVNEVVHDSGHTCFYGSIAVIEDGRYIWSESSGCARLTREDAQADADGMKADALASVAR